MMNNLNNLIYFINAQLVIPRNLLVLEYDGFGLKAFVIDIKGKKIKIGDSFLAHSPNPDRALEEIVTGIQAKFKLPRQAIILSSEAIPALIELPVDAKQPRPDSQMQELVRWEIEPYLTEQFVPRPIGNILIGRGHLTYEQAKEVVEEMEADKNKLQQAAAPRFGELALKKGYVNNAQLKECLEIQERFQFIEDDPIVGWAFQREIDSQEGGKHSVWLACGMSRSVRDHWRVRLERYGIQLKRLYPIMTTSLAAFNGPIRQTRVIFELYKGMLSCIRLSGSAIESLRLYPIIDEMPSAVTCRSLMDKEEGDVWFVGEADYVSGISRQFGPAANSQKEPFLSVIGAVSHMFGKKQRTDICCVLADDPATSAKQKERYRLTAFLLSVIVMFAVCEFSLHTRLKKIRTENARITARLVSLKETNRKTLESAEQAKSLKNYIGQKKKDIEQIGRTAGLMDNILNERPQFLFFLMRALVMAVTDEVILEKIIESQDQAVQVVGWGLTEKSVQQFANNLSKIMDEKGIELRDLSVWTHTGRAGYQGYAFSLNLAARPASQSNNSGEKK